MIDITDYALTLGVPFVGAPEWIDPIVRTGRRDAAFVDTGYLLAMMDPSDGRHSVASSHWATSSLLAYTTPLVIAEVARQLAKSSVPQNWRTGRVSELKRLIVDHTSILVCAPPREVVATALRELDEMQHIIDRLDLCDCLSMTVLRELQHRRVLGFDSDFSVVGATLEP